MSRLGDYIDYQPTEQDKAEFSEWLDSAEFKTLLDRYDNNKSEITPEALADLQAIRTRLDKICEDKLNDTKPNILQRLNAVQGEVDYIQKEKKTGMNYSIVSHDAVTAKVRPLLVKHGIVYWPTNMKLTQNGNRTEMQCEIIFANIDDRTDYILCATAGYGIDTQDKGIGKAISYAVKYALLKTLGLETGDDPDLDQNVKHEPTIAHLPTTHIGTKAGTIQDKDALCNEINNVPSLAILQAWAKKPDVI